MSIRSTKKENPYLRDTIDTLLQISRENNSSLWRTIADKMSSSRSRYADVNLSKIDKVAKDGETLVVPGAVLGSGHLNKNVTIAALKFSKKAAEKAKTSGSTIKSLVELAKDNPKGTNVRIMR
ncbi:MAG: 50S ribosomal protein L18e [Thermoplasmatales archaeon]|nr:50S ribosomal protein L18e [Thermoplasmatales archaeon]MCW6169912.1 50S ribosomal protein L18e [Thermoplasmatales archaeon]